MKILIAQLSFIGDSILSTAVVNNLAVWHPEAEIWVLTTPISKPIFEENPKVTGVIVFDKRGAESGVGGVRRKVKDLQQHNFDTVYSLHRHLRTAVLLWLAKIPKRIGFKRLFYTETVKRDRIQHEVLRNLAILSGHPNFDKASSSLMLPKFETELSAKHKDSIVVFPGSVWATKRYAPEQYRKVVENLIKRGERVVILGARNEVENNQKVSNGLAVLDLTGKTSLPETMSIVSVAKAMICNDSMALHMASAYKIPVVAVFCATSPKFGYGPWQTKSEVVEYSGLWCKPCKRHGSNRCPTGTEKCMKELPAERVLESIERVFY